jgi:hypothetical protein
VIINSHNFTPAAPDYGVPSGAQPIAAWIPSGDTAGNGTTTLTDLAGSNNGALTNMDAAADWVADTDAGGVRAVDFDGSNDHVIINQIPSQTNGTYGAWVRYGGGNRPVMGTSGITTAYVMLFWTITNTIFVGDATATTQVSWPFVQLQWIDIWRHICVVKNGSTLTMYFDGVSQGTRTMTNISPITFLGRGQSPYWLGRLDDMRIFDSALTQSDVEHLAASRGVTL